MSQPNKSESTLENPKEKLQSINQMLITFAAGLIVIIGVRYIAQDLLAPLLLAIFIMVLLFPIFNWFRKKGFSRSLSVILMCVTFFVGAGLLVYFITWSFSLMAETLSVYVESFKATFTQTAESLSVDSETAEAAVQSISPESVLALVGAITSSLGNFIMYFVLIPILAVLMLIQVDSFPKDMSASMLKENKSLQKFPKFAASIMIYIFGRLKVNIVTGVLFAIALYILGVDYAFVWGFLTIILSFIPYIGIVIAGIPPTLIAFATSGIEGAILVIISIVVINLFAENILDPYVQGKGNKISTAAVVIAIVFWTWLLGPIGALLSVPLTVLIKIILADYKETHWVALIMEGNYSEAQEIKPKSVEIKSLRQKIKEIIPSSTSR